MKAKAFHHTRISSRSIFRGIFLIVIGVLIAVAVAIWSFDQEAKKIGLEERIKISKVITDGLAVAIQGDVIERNYTQLESRLRQTISDPKITYILVADTSGSVLSQMRSDLNSNEVTTIYGSQTITAPSQLLEVSKDGRLISRWLQLEAGVPIGWLRVDMASTKKDDILLSLKKNLIFWLFIASLSLIIALFLLWARVQQMILRDEEITKRENEALKEVAFHDTLTGLPNRLLLLDRLEQAIGLSERHQKNFAVCFIDLDGFKLINDTHGHAIGDQVLVEVAYRLGESVRASDTVARLGGDEFVLLLVDTNNEINFKEILDRIISMTSAPLIFANGLSLRVGISMGVTIYPEDKSIPADLIEHADQAMYEVKKMRNGGYAHYKNAIKK